MQQAERGNATFELIQFYCHLLQTPSFPHQIWQSIIAVNTDQQSMRGCRKGWLITYESQSWAALWQECKVRVCIVLKILAAGVQAAHPALQHSQHLQNFLEMDENSWGIEMARGTQEAARRKPGAFQFLRDFGQSTANMINGKTLDEEEDPDYLKVLKRCKSHASKLHLELPCLSQLCGQNGICGQMQRGA